VAGGFQLFFEVNVWNTMKEVVETAKSDLEFAALDKIRTNTKVYIYNYESSVQGKIDSTFFAGSITIPVTYHQCLWYGAIFVHEFVYAVHDKVCANGFINASITKVDIVDDVTFRSIFLSVHSFLFQAFDTAMATSLYSVVRGHYSPFYYSGKAYAATNCLEFFAELSVAYLWKDDDSTEYGMSYPFNRAQLQTHDPASLRVIEEQWLQFEPKGGRKRSSVIRDKIEKTGPSISQKVSSWGISRLVPWTSKK